MILPDFVLTPPSITTRGTEARQESCIGLNLCLVDEPLSGKGLVITHKGFYIVFVLRPQQEMDVVRHDYVADETAMVAEAVVVKTVVEGNHVSSLREELGTPVQD